MGSAERPVSPGVIGHWEYVYDHDEGGYVTGQFLALHDGSVLRRAGGSSSRGDGSSRWSTTWRYTEWEPYMQMDGEASPDAVIAALKARGYGLAKASPVPLDQTEAGPIGGIPGLAEYLE
jgi:hypothetical protein